MKKSFLPLFVLVSVFFFALFSNPRMVSGDQATGSGSLAPSNSVLESKFNLGEFIAASGDKDLHYIKVEVAIDFVGATDAAFTETRDEIREAVTSLLMKLTILQAKQDYISKKLQGDIKKEIERITSARGLNAPTIRRIHIPLFLVN